MSSLLVPIKRLPHALRDVSLRLHAVPRRARREPRELREEYLDVFRVLVDVGDVPISVVAELLDDEALLASDPKQVEDRLLAIRDVWPSQAALNRTIQEYPFVLSDQSWFDRLSRSSVDLTELGWSGAEAARMIVERPDGVYLRKFEMHNSLKALQRILGEDKDSTNVALRFIAKHPAVLLDWQGTFMSRVDRMVAALEFSPEEAAGLLVHHEAVFKADVDAMKATMAPLAEFCGADGHQVARDIVLRAPQILTMTAGRVTDTTRVLRGLGVQARDVALYPKAFVLRHPYRVVGPRTEFMMEHRPSQSLKPTTYLCCSERLFKERYIAGPGQQAAWSAVVAEWERRGTAAAESRENLLVQAAKRAVSPERREAQVVGDGRTPRSASTRNQIKGSGLPAQQQQKSQRKPGRFRKRLTRLPRPANEPNE